MSVKDISKAALELLLNLSFFTDSTDGAAVRTSLPHSQSTPKRFQIEMPFVPPPCDRAMLDAHFLSAVADLLVLFLSESVHLMCCL